MDWKVMRAPTALAVTFGLLTAGLEGRIAGGMGPWDIRLCFGGAVMAGAWALFIWQTLSPKPEQPEPEPHSITIPGLGRLVIGPMGGPPPMPEPTVDSHDEGGPCDCGEVHDPVVVCPLPDGTALVTHRNGEGCDWARRVESPDPDCVMPAVRLHAEFEKCGRQVAKEQ